MHTGSGTSTLQCAVNSLAVLMIKVPMHVWQTWHYLGSAAVLLCRLFLSFLRLLLSKHQALLQRGQLQEQQGSTAEQPSVVQGAAGDKAKADEKSGTQ